MNRIVIYSKADCKLCDEAKALIRALNDTYHFEVQEIILSPVDPEFDRYKNSFPVVLASNGRKLSGNISVEKARALFLSLTPPPRIFYAAKFLEALALAAVMFGLIYGLMGDMWMDLYFFLGGIVVFTAGWFMEKWEARKRTLETVKRHD